jgi:SET domain
VDWNRKSELANNIISFLESFLWTSEQSGARNEALHGVVTLIPGYGVLAQYHSGTHNVDWSHGSVLLRTPPDVPATGVAHPTRGAITPYFNFTITATQPIKAGMELFANFGDVWDTTKENKTDDLYGEKVTRWDYAEADKVLEKVLDFMDKYHDQMKPEQADEVLDFILGKILDTAAGDRAKAIRSLIPAHLGKLQTVKDMGGTFQYRNSNLVKSKKWLAKHGTCVDNIKSGPSTIPEAGRGAFATRDLPEGTVIAPMPMLQIPDKAILNVYEMDGNEPILEKPPIGQQLVINYCYGHPESNMLLMPVGSMVNLINHQPAEQANAKVRWSDNPHWGTRWDFLEQSPEELATADYDYIGAVMEVVATRDIAAGDEVFIDYGSEWAAAWEKYMKDWEDKYKENPEQWPFKADDLKMEYRNKPFKTEQELEATPYPDGVQTACFIEWEDVEDGRVMETKDGKGMAEWIGPVEFKRYSGLKMEICDVLERSKQLEDGLYNYTVLTEELQIENVPHAAITFVDEPYRSDIHTKEAFRHPIIIPDAMFPQAWRDHR